MSNLTLVFNCRTVAVDLRGYGDSGKPSGVKNYSMPYLVDDIKQVIGALGLYAH